MMVFIGVLPALLIAGAVIDLRARRRGRRVRVDGRALGDSRRRNESELDLGANGQLRGLRGLRCNGGGGLY